MSTNAGPGSGPDPRTDPRTDSRTDSGSTRKPGSTASRLEEAVESIEAEVRQAIGYVNDKVVPQVRRESISAMRSIADTLRSLADRIEREQQPRGPQSR